MPVQNVTVPGNGFRPASQAQAEATAFQAKCALASLRLFKASAGDPSKQWVLADYEAEEADFSGYTADGVEITAAGEPYRDGLETYAVTLPSVQFNHAGGSPGTPNQIGGAYLVSAADELLAVVQFPEPVSLSTDADSLVVVVTVKFKA